jgi:mono/diheme cytochrome c family protein
MRWSWTLAVVAVVAVDRCAQGQEAKKPAVASPAAAQFFETKVRPVLAEHCFKCHGDVKKPKGELRLDSLSGMLAGGDQGPAIVPRHPDKSLLVKAINWTGDLKMPPTKKLDREQIADLTQWIAMGAPWPGGDKPLVARKDDFHISDKDRAHWSFQPIRRPALPAVKNPKWVSNPVDAFILAGLESKGLRPNPPASPRELVRRVYYDLIGLPPTPEQVEAFVKDPSPDAYETLIERLFESPHYGEKWGRHWLDLVRFAETNSYERDNPKPHTWRYRDYVIRAFNENTPLDQFIRDQLAGDELRPDDPEALIATGYHRLGIWDDEPSDAVLARYDGLDDIIATTSQIFLGLTIDCARCHNHKIDPIPQKDYYRLLAFFHNINHFKNGGPTDEQPIFANRKAREQYVAAVGKLADQRRALGAEIARLEEAFRVAYEERFKAAPNIKRLIGGKEGMELLGDERFAEYQKLVKGLESLKKKEPAVERCLCVTESGPKPPATHILVRGNPHIKGDKVEPGFPTVLNVPDPVISPRPGAKSSGRRTALANWMTSKDNPLTPRVMANRIWQYHFGRGIVRSPNDFGLQGSRPTHPELLDWLTSELIKHDWRIKPLHRLILTSSAYRMSSRGNPEGLKADPANDLFWRFDMRRLTAEEIRDSILAVSGNLNPKMHGPGIFPEIPKEVLAGQSMPGRGWDKSSPEEQARRSIYIHVKRSLLYPLMESFDVAETDRSTPVRFATTQPTQALLMLNGEFLNKQAAIFAERLGKEAGGDLALQVRRALSLAMQRAPTAADVNRGTELIRKLHAEEMMPPTVALQAFCLVVLNLNEFMYLD